MKTTLCLLLLACFVVPSQSLFAQRETKLQRKLRAIVIDHIEVEDVSVEALVKLIRIRAKDLDPAKEGINIILLLDPPKKKKQAKKKKKTKVDDDLDIIAEATGEAVGDNRTPVTLIFDNIALGVALKNICRAANLVYKVEQYAVVIASKDFPISKMETRIYPVEKGAVSEI